MSEFVAEKDSLTFEKGGALAHNAENFVIGYTDAFGTRYSLAELAPGLAHEVGRKLRRLYPTPPAR